MHREQDIANIAERNLKNLAELFKQFEQTDERRRRPLRLYSEVEKANEKFGPSRDHLFELLRAGKTADACSVSGAKTRPPTGRCGRRTRLRSWRSIKVKERRKKIRSSYATRSRRRDRPCGFKAVPCWLAWGLCGFSGVSLLDFVDLPVPMKSGLYGGRPT